MKQEDPIWNFFAESGFFFSRFHLTEFNIKVNLNQS